MTRMFVAAIPPEPVVEHLEEYVGPRREHGAFRWTAPEQWHVTLAFMDQVADRALDDLVEHLAAAAARRRPLTLRIGGGGAFPDPARAKVLVAGLAAGPASGSARGAGEADEPGEADDRAELDRLAAGARTAATTAGIEVDGRRFRPHLTLARTGRPTELTRWVRIFDAYDGPDWVVAEIAPVASYLGEGPRRRPRYEVVERFGLGGDQRPRW